MPLNPSGGGGATSPTTYYNTPTIIGNYQFISLSDVINNFIAAYVGEGKILSTVLAGDIKFHAHRALQELSYDTLKSCKSQEIEVCPSLTMPLPHDYVNYVKLTSVDANGIEHPLYPNRNTSNPFAISQSEDCGYDINATGGLVHQEICEDGVETTCSADDFNYMLNNFLGQGSFVPINCSTNACFPLTLKLPSGDVTVYDIIELQQLYAATQDAYCNCLASLGPNSPVNCGTLSAWNYGGFKNGLTGGWSGGSAIGGESNEYVIRNNGTFTFNLPSFTETSGGICTSTSNAWSGFSSNSSGTTVGNISVDPAEDGKGYFDNTGKRYGLETSLANANGTYFMDCLRGNIHFSSDLSGKTIILKYISDGHGTEDEEIVPKLAEEAIYKWIAYGCLSARVGVPEYVIARFKKEKASETRKAKIRLSNIKIEEISQVFRGKSKWIKH